MTKTNKQTSPQSHNAYYLCAIPQPIHLPYQTDSYRCQEMLPLETMTSFCSSLAPKLDIGQNDPRLLSTVPQIVFISSLSPSQTFANFIS